MSKLLIIAFVFVILAHVSFVHAGTIFQEGDYTTPGMIDGDLIIMNGNVNITSGDLLVFGDIHLSCGNLEFDGGGTLYVAGDITMTNTNVTGVLDAHISVTGNVVVGGDIKTKSVNGDAYIYLDGNSRSFMAGSITTRGKYDAFLGAIDYNGTLTWNSIIDIDNDITIKSDQGHAYVGVYTYTTTDVSIGFGTEGLAAQIFADGDISTNANSANHSAHVGTNSEEDFDTSHLFVGGNLAVTNRAGDAFIRCGQLYVCGEIQTYAGTEHGAAYIYTSSTGGIVASSISTFGYDDASITATVSSIKSTGDINLRSSHGNATIYARDELHSGNIHMYGAQQSGFLENTSTASVSGGNIRINL